MLAFNTFYENKTLMFSAGAVAFLVAALLILFIFRLAFGRRIHMPGGGRARQPRLGVVDAFDLDRQRQLVLVRRDNVEHLVMIGGPNDVLIESQIVRAEAREVPRPRDKEPTVAPLTWTASTPQAAPAAPPSVAAEPKLVPEEPVAALKQAAPPISPAPASTIAPAPLSTPQVTSPPPARAPFLPLPPRRPPLSPPSFGIKPAPMGATPPSGAAQDSDGRPIPAAAPRVLSTPPSFLRPKPAAAPVVPPVAASSTVEAAGASTAPEVVPVPPAKPAPAPTSADALESLEEEMAKLLGRGSKE